jgi:hypothetical protein
MRTFLVVAMLLSVCLTGKASHIAGGELTYRYIGDSTGVANQYEITLTLMRDNAGIGMQSAVSITITSSCFSSLTSSLTLISGSAGTSDPNYDRCDYGVMFYPYEKYVYRGIATLPAVCSEFEISYSNCCRSGIDNLLNSISQGIYISAKSTSLLQNSSSTSFYNSPRAFLVGQEVDWYHFVADEDGDSLFAELSPAMESNSNQPASLSYNSGYSATIPLISDPAIGFNIDLETGNIHFKPTAQQVGTVAMKITEYRYDSTVANYQKVGERILEKMANVLSISGQSPAAITFDSTGTSTYPCGQKFIEFNTSHSFIETSLSVDATDFLVIDPNGFLVPVVTAEALNTTSFLSNTIRLNLLDSLDVNGTYTIKAREGSDGNTLQNECQSALAVNDSFTITVSGCSGIGIEENRLTEMNAYPIPARDVLHVSFVTPVNRQLQLVNAAGIAVINKETDDLLVDLTIEHLPAGVYVLYVTTGSGITTQKIVKH